MEFCVSLLQYSITPVMQLSITFFEWTEKNEQKTWRKIDELSL
jgi:hypothetical protein